MYDKTKCPVCGEWAEAEHWIAIEELGVEGSDGIRCYYCGYDRQPVLRPDHELIRLGEAEPGVWPSARRLYELARADEEGRVVPAAHWINTVCWLDNETRAHVAECSACHWLWLLNDDPDGCGELYRSFSDIVDEYKFCPHCGAKMGPDTAPEKEAHTT